MGKKTKRILGVNVDKLRKEQEAVQKSGTRYSSSVANELLGLYDEAKEGIATSLSFNKRTEGVSKVKNSFTKAINKALSVGILSQEDHQVLKDKLSQMK